MNHNNANCVRVFFKENNIDLLIHLLVVAFMHCVVLVIVEPRHSSCEATYLFIDLCGSVSRIPFFIFLCVGCLFLMVEQIALRKKKKKKGGIGE